MVRGAAACVQSTFSGYIARSMGRRQAITDLTASALAPAWYMTGAVLIGGVAMTLMPETAPVKVGLARGH
jgi:hypothetical protein